MMLEARPQVGFLEAAGGKSLFSSRYNDDLKNAIGSHSCKPTHERAQADGQARNHRMSPNDITSPARLAFCSRLSVRG